MPAILLLPASRSGLDPEIPVEAAKAAALRYVSDRQPGIRRIRVGQAFRYVDPQGRAIRDAETLRRIRSIVIPPAWRDVWICPLASGHLQAVGRDAAGRKQYRYHPRWREVRDETKYGRLSAFARSLPRIRRRIDADLALPGIPRRKVQAMLVRLLEATLIRIGNEEYARSNGSFGLTTLRNRHARINGSTIHFQFRGKSGILHTIDVNDRRLARLVKRCQDLPGCSLFAYLDEQGRPQSIDSADVNEYLREISGENFTAKDFRTWAGTLAAAQLLCGQDAGVTQRQRKKAVVEAIKTVAQRLGNTTAVCRRCYVHPAIIEAYSSGTLSAEFRNADSRRAGPRVRGLSAAENALLRFLIDRGPELIRAS